MTCATPPPVLLTVLLTLLVVRAAPAQRIPASQHGSVTQRVGSTDIAVSYNRPVARGRRLFGELVRWGHIWHPGADSATTITFSRDVAIAGHDVAAGRYTLWTIPAGPPKPWTLLLRPGGGGWHTQDSGETLGPVRHPRCPGRGRR